MSSLLRRMQRMASRDQRAKKAAINRQFATRLGISNDTGKSVLKPGRKPRALRRCKPNKAQLARQARRAGA